MADSTLSALTNIPLPVQNADIIYGVRSNTSYQVGVSGIAGAPIFTGWSGQSAANLASTGSQLTTTLTNASGQLVTYITNSGSSNYTLITGNTNALSGFAQTGAKTVAFNVVTNPVYLVSPSDAFNVISMSGTQAQQVILPSGNNFSIGTQVLIERYGTGTVNIGVTGGIIFQSRSGISGLAAQFSIGTVILRNNTTWVGAGDFA